MRIAIDITPLETPHSRRGIGWYTKYLLESLKKYEPNNSYNLFIRGENIPKNVDLIHFPYFDLFFSTFPARRPAKTVVTVHDLTPIVYLSSFKPGFFGRLNWFWQKNKIKNVETIITDSQSSKKDIIRFIGYPEDRIEVVYLAPAARFKPVHDAELLKRIKQKYQLSKKFMMYVGDINYNKNIIGLLKAFSGILNSFPSLQLILVGEAFLGSSKEADLIDQQIDRLNLQKKARRLGFVPPDDLVILYNSAQVYVQPSFYEGFGLPVVEAMACACPVVTTDAGALPEVAGKAAVYADADNIESLIQAIIKVLNLKAEKRRELIEKGYRQAAKFSWRRTAYQTIKVYQKVVSGK